MRLLAWPRVFLNMCLFASPGCDQGILYYETALAVSNEYDWKVLCSIFALGGKIIQQGFGMAAQSISRHHMFPIRYVGIIFENEIACIG